MLDILLFRNLKNWMIKLNVLCCMEHWNYDPIPKILDIPSLNKTICFSAYYIYSKMNRASCLALTKKRALASECRSATIYLIMAPITRLDIADRLMGH